MRKFSCIFVNLQRLTKRLNPWPLFRYIISARLSPNENENSPKRQETKAGGVFLKKTADTAGLHRPAVFLISIFAYA